MLLQYTQYSKKYFFKIAQIHFCIQITMQLYNIFLYYSSYMYHFLLFLSSLSVFSALFYVHLITLNRHLLFAVFFNKQRLTTMTEIPLLIKLDVFLPFEVFHNVVYLPVRYPFYWIFSFKFALFPFDSSIKFVSFRQKLDSFFSILTLFCFFTRMIGSKET